jgi:hypothetical protein
MVHFRYVCDDHPEIRQAMDSSHLLLKTNPLSFDSMLLLCKTYNKAVDKLIAVRIVICSLAIRRLVNSTIHQLLKRT